MNSAYSTYNPETSARSHTSIYLSSSTNQTSGSKSENKEPPKEEKKAAATSDPRASLLGAASAAPAPAPAPAPAAAPAATAPAPAIGGFDPAAFAKQLQQLQQLQQGTAAGPVAPGMPTGGAPPPMPGRTAGHTEEGYHAGNIFIPAKDEGKMFIGGLNWETTDESMKNYFSAFGEVLDVNVMRDPNTGRSRGFGFLTFRDAQSVTEVLKREHFLDGKIIDPKRAIPREEQDKTAKIFVGGVGMDVTEDDFKNFFETFGTVIDAQLMIDKDTGRPRGFGFVTFDDHAAVDKIVAEKFLDLKGKSIEVKRAEPRLSREWQARNQGYRQMGAMGGMMNPMAAMGGYPNAMDPQMMTQYYQQWQNYMSQMQGMMGNNTPGSGSASPSAEPEASRSEDDRDPRRDRRRADDRRRSRSPPGNRRRRGGAFARDPRDRNYRR